MAPFSWIDPIHVGPLTLQPFGMLGAMGEVIGSKPAVRRARSLGMHVGHLSSFITWFLVFGSVGGRVLNTSVVYGPSPTRDYGWMQLRCGVEPRYHIRLLELFSTIGSRAARLLYDGCACAQIGCQLRLSSDQKSAAALRSCVTRALTTPV